jgi:epoxyqueuosine reductase
VIVCAINYNTAHPYSTQVHDPGRGWISRYAWSREDYHDAALRRLQNVEAALRQSLPVALQPTLTTRSYVDTGPIVERVCAKYAGVGWIGKNTCLINQKKGSWLFLGVILTSLELAPDMPAPDRCGTCTRCIDACPTDAFLGPYQLGHHVFGCDICQDVCPWNRKAPASTAPEFQPRPGLVNPALAWLAQMSEENFRQTFRGSPIRRTKRGGLRRNAAIAMGNSGNREFLPILEKLASDEDQSVSESASWAKTRLSSKI